MSDEPLIAIFVDFENLALGVRDLKGYKFDIDLILKRLLEKGRVVYKRAYCDWSRYRDAVREFHRHGIVFTRIQVLTDLFGTGSRNVCCTQKNNAGIAFVMTDETCRTVLLRLHGLCYDFQNGRILTYFNRCYAEKFQSLYCFSQP